MEAEAARVGDEGFRLREVLLGGVTVTLVPRPVGQERLRLGRGLRLADGEQRVACLLERVLPSIVPHQVE